MCNNFIIFFKNNFTTTLNGHFLLLNFFYEGELNSVISVELMTPNDKHFLSPQDIEMKALKAFRKAGVLVL